MYIINMKRQIYQDLITWKEDPFRKPLLLLGARQTGKTFLLKEFGKTEYQKIIYCNFEEDPGLRDLFSGSLKPEKILQSIGAYLNVQVEPADDLIFFDEIQSCDNALNALKYFCEDAPHVHVVAAGSLLGVKLTESVSFPVGKVNLRTLYPMTFCEYLEGLGETQIVQMLDGITAMEPLPPPIHLRLVELLRSYYLVGGMPEAVRVFEVTRSVSRVRQVHADILGSYVRDFAKHAPTSDIPKLTIIWEALSTQLARENKKFIFSALAKSARGREFESAIQWLRDAGLILVANNVSTVQQPLAGFKDRGAFKVYLLDTGLLSTMARIPESLIVHPDELFTTYHGMLAENFVAQQLTALIQAPLYYWRSDAYGAEVDFLCDHTPDIYPLEVKSGINPRSKSLRSFDERFHPPKLLRTTLLNFVNQERIVNIPLYGLHLLPRILGLFPSTG